MNEQALRFGGGGDTNLTPIALVLLVLACMAILVLPRKYVIVPLVLTAVVIPQTQRLVLFGLHFGTLRVLLATAWLRLCVTGLAGRDAAPFRVTPVDKTIAAWALASAAAFVLLWSDWGALVLKLGFLYDTFGIYFVFRLLARDEESLSRLMATFAAVCVIVSACMLYEQISGHNLFYGMGGVTEQTLVRDGRLRAQGPFAHPILAGAFGAVQVPIFIGLWSRRNHKLAAALGIVAAIVIVIASMSSTPQLALVAGVFALCLWPLRTYTRFFRWSVAFGLILLHMVMKAPVWALISRVDLTGSSSSYHRFQLVDQAIRHFGDWWLCGTRLTGVWGWDLWDTANTFVENAVQGGLITFWLFTGILIVAYKNLGKRRRKIEKTDRAGAWQLWVLGAALTANAVAFFGITYFDQTILVWYALLAAIAGSACVPPAQIAAESAVVVSRWAQSQPIHIRG